MRYNEAHLYSMNIEELYERLLAEGCGHFYIRSHLHKQAEWAQYCGVHALRKRHGVWSVCYTERSDSSPPSFETTSESEACEYYYKLVTSYEHTHNVGVFEDKNLALALKDELEAIGISATHQDTVPRQQGRPNLQVVSVVGTDIFKVRELHDELPLRDYELPLR